MIKFKNILIESIKDKLYKDALEFREELEDYEDWHNDKTVFKGTCQYIAKKLAEYLNKLGYTTKRIGGQYQNVSDEFEPNMEDGDGEDKEDFIDNFDNTGKHGWVEVDNKGIVDITADQFHPGEEDDYRVIITDINDSDYK